MVREMNIILGTDAFGVAALQKLNKKHNIVLVVTQPDSKNRRGGGFSVSPIKEKAQELGLSIFQPERLREKEATAQIIAKSPDLIITASYGQILPKAVLEASRLASVNLHASLLPKYRGAAPIERAIMDGESVTGVTLMHMDVGLDTGDIIDTQEVRLMPGHNYGSLYSELSEAAAELLMRNLEALELRAAKRQKQDEALATYAHKITDTDECIDWAKDANEIANQIRALSPKRGAYTLHGGKILKIWSAVADSEFSGRPGEVVRAKKDALVVTCGSGALYIREIQPAGKKIMDARAFNNGNQHIEGSFFGGEV
jgi:methionyl-tRNA formyltransferase